MPNKAGALRPDTVNVLDHKSPDARHRNGSNGRTTTVSGRQRSEGPLAGVPCMGHLSRLNCRLKVLAAGLLFCAAVVSSSFAVIYCQHGALFFGSGSLFFGSGPEGLPWVPPDERPIPLSAFPSYAGYNFTDEGNAVRLKTGFGGRHIGPPTTLLFLHLWKCAGSSLRHLLREWAELERQSIAIVVRCDDKVSPQGKVCLHDHHLLDAEVQDPFIKKQQVLAGHFTWGFQTHARQPYVMFTTLRNPLELFVSGQQYLNRKATRVFSNAVALVEVTMRTAVDAHKARIRAMESALLDGREAALAQTQAGKSVGYIYRLVEAESLKTKGLEEAAVEAMENLDTLWLVGVVEQYQGFMAVLQGMMDPLERHSTLWKKYAVGKYNTSRNGAAQVLAAIDPDLVRAFNETLSEQWKVYSHAVGLYQLRCQQMLSASDKHMCEVPDAPSLYELTDEEKEELYNLAEYFAPSEVARAHVLWAEYNSNHSSLVADDVRSYFKGQGFDLTDPTKQNNLWKALKIWKLLHVPRYLPVGLDGGPEGANETTLEAITTPFSEAEVEHARLLLKEYLSMYGHDPSSSSYLDVNAKGLWNFLRERGLDLRDPGRRDGLWDELEIARVFEAPGVWRENDEVVRFSEAELSRAKALWQEFGGASEGGTGHAKPDDIVRYFETKGFDLTDEDRALDLWRTLNITMEHSVPSVDPIRVEDGNHTVYVHSSPEDTGRSERNDSSGNPTQNSTSDSYRGPEQSVVAVGAGLSSVSGAALAEAGH